MQRAEVQCGTAQCSVAQRSAVLPGKLPPGAFDPAALPLLPATTATVHSAHTISLHGGR